MNRGLYSAYFIVQQFFRKDFWYARMTSLKIKRLIWFSLLLLAIFMSTLRQWMENYCGTRWPTYFFHEEKRALVLIMFCSYLWTCCLNSVKRSTNGRITIFPPTLLRGDNIGQKYITFWACPSANGVYGNFLFSFLIIFREEHFSIQILYFYSVCADTLENKCNGVLLKLLSRIFDIPRCDVIYYVTYVICSHYIRKPW